MKITEWNFWSRKNTITKMKNSLEGPNSRHEPAEGRISEPEGRSSLIISPKRQEEKELENHTFLNEKLSSVSGETMLKQASWS